MMQFGSPNEAENDTSKHDDQKQHTGTDHAGKSDDKTMQPAADTNKDAAKKM